MTAMLSEVASAHGVSMPGCVAWEDPILVVDGPVCQGDVSVLPVTTAHGGEPIPAGGVEIARGDSGHPHSLHGAGLWAPAKRRAGSVVVGWVTVPAGAEVFLLHAGPHGGFKLAAGTYRLGGQREWAAEWRRVAD